MNLKLITLTFVLLSHLFATINISAQTIFVTIGTGTSTNSTTSYPAPYGNWYWGARHQFLIRSSELIGAGLSAGNIYSLGFNVFSPNGVPLDNFTIKIKSTSSNSTTSTFESGMTTVWGPQTYTETNGWNTHTFTTPFVWNGTSNILIETCFNNSSYTYNAQIYYSTTSFNSTIYYREDASGVCSNVTGTTLTSRPNIRLEYDLPAVPPVADFMADFTFSCNGTIYFSDLSLYAPDSWYWDFGDGNSDTVQNPIHTYTAGGTYSVSLTVTNPYGTDSIIKTNYITVSLGGPVTATCTPVTASYCCGLGIYNVTFNTINNSTNDGVEGYQDYTCTNSTTVETGQSYTISIQTGPTYEENVMVWIDYNNNGAFSGTEVVFSSYNVFTNHTGTVNIPVSAVTNNPLRMRVASDYGLQPVPSPCIDVVYGQFEDYTVIIQPDTMPPVADFIADATLSCNGVVNFIDLSTNSPTSWFWDFGDGNNDTVQNPTHTYTIDTIYTVMLIASNAYGSDTIIKPDYVTVNTVSGGPVPASCTPATLNYQSGFGITNVSFNTINNTTADGIEGYQDYTCSQGTDVTAGQVYTISAVTDNPTAHNVRAWIDYNNDGNLNNSSELIFAADSVLTSSETVTISPTAVLNTPLRMRVSADYVFMAIPTPCSDVVYGQVEDYSVTVTPNITPPIADFSVDDIITCDGVINFYDQSSNVPTFWFWDFGDGTTSYLQNPSYTYSNDNTYTVTLIVCNAFGCDTITYPDLINVTIGAAPIAPSCTPTTLGYCCGYGIYNVTLNTINNSSGNGADGYKDYSCTFNTILKEGLTYSISVGTGISNPQDTRGWIDFNNDGVFDGITELVFSANDNYNPSGTITIPFGAVIDTALRMRVSSDYSGSNPNPCNDSWYGQVEDYTVIIEEVVPPAADFTVSMDSICAGGSISFIDQSTENPASWSWTFPGGNPGTSSLKNPTVTYNTPGIYDVTLIVTNGIGSDTLTINACITVNSKPSLTITGFDITCIGFCDGYATVAVTGGTAPYTYLWSNGQTSSTDTSLCSGMYGISVIDVNVCSSYGSVVITEPSAIVLTVSSTSAGCSTSNGTSSANVSGGTGPYTYSWDDPSNQTTATASGLFAGIYTVTVTDNNGCFDTDSVTVTNTNAPILNTSSTSPACYGDNNGSATVTVTSGTPPYTYQWDDPASQTTTTATGLTAWTYNITVTDDNACTASAGVTIGEPGTIVISITWTDPSCSGECNGSATLTASGGTPPYSYLWDDPLFQTTSTATGLCAGNYNLTVTDNNGCSTAASVTINDPAGIILTITTTDASCGIADGSATVSGTGGMWPYTYLWDDPANQTTETATGIAAGGYSVIVTDANNCTETANATVNDAGGANVMISDSTDVSCYGGNDGSATLTASGGTPPYSYLWDDTMSQITITATGLSAGTYNVLVTDLNGCSSSENVTINEPAALNAAITSSNDNSCYGECYGDATVSVSGGTTPYTFLWDDPQVQTTITVTGLCAGTYVVTITDANGCTVSKSVTITEPPAILLNTTTIDATCSNPNGSATVTATGGTAPYTYQWDDPASQITDVATGLYAGTYTVIVTDASNCSSFTSATVNGPLAPVIASAGSDVDTTYLDLGGGVAFFSNSTGGTSYFWDFGDGTTTTMEDPQYAYTIEGDYSVVLFVTNGTCSDSDTLLITVLDSSVGIDVDMLHKTSLHIYPNPTSNFITVTYDFNGKRDLDILICDVLGQRIYKEKIYGASDYKKDIDLSGCPKGVYFIKLQDSGGDVFVEKIIVH
ncbi:MAG: PKD domain-containing protein [Bacteroidota bacterium]